MRANDSGERKLSVQVGSRRVIAVILVAFTLGTSMSVVDAARASTRVDVSARCNSPWIVSAHEYGYDRNVIVKIEPTGLARWAGRFDPAIWNDLWSCIPYPSTGLYGWQGDSMYKQLACHAVYSASVPGITSWTGGVTWDLESWRSNVSWFTVWRVWGHKCNWS